jgi:hypothetical protein
MFSLRRCGHAALRGPLLCRNGTSPLASRLLREGEPRSNGFATMFTMSRYALRCAIAGAASLAAILPLQVPSARAGEVITTDCSRGFGEGHEFAVNNDFGSSYGNGYGDTYSSAYSDSFSRGARFGHRRGFVGATRDGSGGGTRSGAAGGTGSGYETGYANGSGTGSSSGYFSRSCIEIRHELTNPYIIHIAPPRTAEEIADANERDRLWRTRCKPIVKQDVYGVPRYSYAAPGCDYGKFE